MRKTILLFAAFLILFTQIYPCTTFILKTKNGLYFGRNLDWVSSHGIIVVNKKGLSKESLVFPPEKIWHGPPNTGALVLISLAKNFLMVV